jgi:hypothetical protein
MERRFEKTAASLLEAQKPLLFSRYVIAETVAYRFAE